MANDVIVITRKRKAVVVDKWFGLFVGVCFAFATFIFVIGAEEWLDVVNIVFFGGFSWIWFSSYRFWKKALKDDVIWLDEK